MSEWQPISTAPKDGTRILLWGTCHASGANYFDTEPQAMVGRYGKLGDLADYSKEWEADPVDYYGIEIRPTHWMTLPSPPPVPEE